MDHVLINSFDLPPTGNEIWASDELGGLSHIDLRQDKSKARRWELSEKKTGCVSINPVQPHMLLVSSNSRILRQVECDRVNNIWAHLIFSRIWDSRKLSKMPVLESEGDEFPPSYGLDIVSAYDTENTGTKLAECQHNKSVTAAYWDPSGSNIVSTCYDDRLRR